MPDEIKSESTPPANLSIVPQPLPATTFAPQSDFKDAPPNTPMFAPVKHPLRFAIHGKQHMIDPLKDLIAADTKIPDAYKAMLHHELNNTIKSNGAKVDLHIVDHPDGGVSIQGHIKPIQLG